MAQLNEPAARVDRKPVFALLAAETVSQLGNIMSAVAVPWFVLTTTGSAALTGSLAKQEVALGAMSATTGLAIAERQILRR